MAKYEMPEHVLCIDPGKTSGIALLRITDGEAEKVWSVELDYMESCNLINKTIIEYGPKLRVVYEKFIITPMTAKNSVAPWSLELIGVIKYLTGAYAVETVVSHTSSAAKTFCPNARLKSVGLWHKGGDHARDALRHGVMHLVDCGWHHEKLLQ
jgi:hypothetical protein